jgi:hypothetical protein
MFVTQHIENTLRRRAVFNCGQEQVLLWGAPKTSDAEEIAGRLKFVTSHVIDRAEAEFEELRCFSCFDVPVVRDAFECTDAREARNSQLILLGHIEKIATSLQVDESIAVEEYTQIAPKIVISTSPGRSLEKASNNEVWQAVLNYRERSMRALHLCIRYYISIEDGECVVERDLGLLTSFNDAHQNVNGELADDLMLTRSDPVQGSDIICGGEEEEGSGKSSMELAVGSCPRLGSKSRRWATLWRTVYGARLGCYRKTRQQGQRGKKRSGTYTAAKHGVLAAAEYAVEMHMQHPANQERGPGGLTPLGVSTSFLKSAVGDAAAETYNNDNMKRFRKLTEDKKQNNHKFVGRLLAGKWKEIKAAKSPQKLHVKKICFVGDIGQGLPHPIADGQAGLEEVRGGNRCFQADLAVVDDLSRVVDCSDDATVNQLLSIVGRGVPVITRASWFLASGDIERVPKESVLRHVRLVERTKVLFEYDDYFQARAGNIVNTLRALSRLQNSKWKVRKDLNKSSAVGESGISVAVDGRSSVVSLRAHGGGDVLRSWVGENRRIVNSLGSKAWSMTGPMI